MGSFISRPIPKNGQQILRGCSRRAFFCKSLNRYADITEGDDQRPTHPTDFKARRTPGKKKYSTSTKKVMKKNTRRGEGQKRGNREGREKIR
jgi:hypothetical protein